MQQKIACDWIPSMSFSERWTTQEVLPGSEACYFENSILVNQLAIKNLFLYLP